ncbi:hypothetical protein M426DRAFT_321411 [Hypoxylon sp. CI-4A]|nr:hypothetical protein M426DRAFT_321411 [Hypoxylon sp. CI-4A]
MVVEKKLDPATVKLPWDRRTVIPMIMQEDAAKELANWSYTPDITTPVYHDPNVEVGNLPTVLSQGFTGSFATFKASDYFKKHKSQKNLPHSQPQPHNQPQPPIQPQPQPQPQLQPQQPIQPQQPQLDQEETKQRAHRLAQQQHALRLAHQRASMDVDQTPPGGSMGIHMEPVEEAYQNRKRSGGPHLGK